MSLVLKVYLHPKGLKRGFEIVEVSDWARECLIERGLDCLSGCSSMSQVNSKPEAIDLARKMLGAELFNKCF